MCKKLPTIITITFVSIFIIQMICLIFLLFTPNKTQADVNFEPQITIGDIKSDTAYPISKGDTSLISQYIRAIYVYAIGMVGIVATVVMMFGGVLWIAAGGNASKISEAKAWIFSSLTGLLLALSSYMILYTVNPALVNLEMANIEGGTVATGSGCCESGGTCSSSLNTECDGTFYSGRTCDPTSGKCISTTIETKDDYGCCSINYNTGCSITQANGIIFCKQSPITREACTTFLNAAKKECPNASMTLSTYCTGLESGGLTSECRYITTQ